MKILLTGASGFLGSHLIKAFSNTIGEESLIIVSSRRHNLKTVLRVETDILLEESHYRDLERVTHLIHVGSFMPKSPAELELDVEAQKSFVFTKNLLSLPLPSLRKILFISSTDVYLRQGRTIDEYSPVLATNAYSKMKIASEKLVSNYAEEQNCTLNILRLGHLFGSGDEKYRKLVQNLVRAIKLSEKVFLRNGLEQKLNLMYVVDASRIIYEVANRQLKSGVSNIVSSKPCSIQHLIASLESASRKSISYEVICPEVDEFKYSFKHSNLFQLFQFEETPLHEALQESYFEAKSN